MPKPLSRRNFLSRATTTATVSGVLNGTLADSEPEADAAPPSAAPLTAVPLPPYKSTTAQMALAYERARAYDEQTPAPVLNARIVPHWFGANDAHFWYRRDGQNETRTFLLVNTETGVKAPAFDHARLAQALGKTAGVPLDAERLAFANIAFSDDLKTVRIALRGQTYVCDLTTYECVKSDVPLRADTIPPPGPAPRGRRSGQSSVQRADAPYELFLKDNNVWMRPRPNSEGSANAEAVALTTTGTSEKPFGELRSAPNGALAVAYRKTDVPILPVYMVESSPKNTGAARATGANYGTRGVLHQHEYAQPGDPFPTWEMWAFVPGEKSAKQVENGTISSGGPLAPIWVGESAGTPPRFFFSLPDRGHQRFRVMECDAATGKTRAIVDEKIADPTKSFINTSNVWTHTTNDGASVLYASEQDGWRHLYRYDTESHRETREINGVQITKGPWVVRDVERVDEAEKQIWFWASGKNIGEDPYNLHLYCVGFDGANLTEITQDDGSHSVQFSPSRRFVIDTVSRPDLPPVHVLRRADTGTEVCPLEKADVSALQKAGWHAPEVFHAKGRDKQTDIWGLVFRPSQFDPAKRYPVIENIYAGPQDSFTRKTFGVRDGMQALAELGFIVVQCDGMGTRNRSKAFHDVCWRNLKDAGLPDRIAWIKALAQKYKTVDTSRVGIYGTSAGGQNVGSALLFHPEFYKVGVSSCGCHDNRVDKQWWNEQWMGYPVGPWYDDSSNVVHAANLRGKLLLMVGELDSNVPPESTLQVADALMKADKDFDLLVLPGLNHTSGGAYGERRRRDYFVQHLLGVIPPDRNAPRPKAEAVKPVLLPPHPTTDTYLASGDGGPDTSITFRNQTKETIHLFWLASMDAKPAAYGDIAPGQTRDLHTFQGHVWLVTGASNNEIALFVADAKPGIAEIKPAP